MEKIATVVVLGSSNDSVFTRKQLYAAVLENYLCLTNLARGKCFVITVSRNKKWVLWTYCYIEKRDLNLVMMLKPSSG